MYTLFFATEKSRKKMLVVSGDKVRHMQNEMRETASLADRNTCGQIPVSRFMCELYA